MIFIFILNTARRKLNVLSLTGKPESDESNQSEKLYIYTRMYINREKEREREGEGEIYYYSLGNESKNSGAHEGLFALGVK
jgi:hypothetical protein